MRFIKLKNRFMKHMRTVASISLALAITLSSAAIMANADTSTTSSTMSGSGTSADPYIVTTAVQLEEINTTGLGLCYKLGNDIDCSTYASWTPIGNKSTAFTGTFDGNGHNITGVQNGTSTATIGYGLFGDIGSAGTVKNVGVNVAFYCTPTSATNGCGALIGILSGTITNCHASGIITTSSNIKYADNVIGFESIGGLIGVCNSSGTISNSYATTNITSSSNTADIGGLVGEAEGGTISNSYATGMVSSSNSSINDAVGGLIGYSIGTISSSYATGAVTGHNYVGGLVGRYSYGTIGTIINNYATGAVAGNTDVGGLIGSNESKNTIINNYATGAVTGNTAAGGLFGYKSNSSESDYNYTSGKNPNKYSGITIMNAVSMQAQTFADTLNSNITSLSLTGCSAWKYSSSINNGYPYLDGVGVGAQTTDTTPPTGTYTLSPSDSTAGSVTINFTASDADSGVKSITLPDGSNVTTSTAKYEVSKNGSYDFTVTDNSGNTAKIAATVSNITASTGPVISATSTLASDSKSATVTIKIADNADASTMKWASGNQNAAYFSANGSAIENTYSISDSEIKAGGAFNVTANGTYTIYAKDSNGTENVYTINITGIAGSASSETSSQTDTVPISGTINGSTVSVTHPTSIAYSIASDGTFTSPDFAITNSSSGSVKVSVVSLKSTTGGTLQFADVASNAKDWSNLDLADSKQYIALGIKADTSTSWNTGVSTDTYWSANNTTSLIGSIAQNATASLQLTAKNGHVFDQSYTAKHSLVLQFDLA